LHHYVNTLVASMFLCYQYYLNEGQCFHLS
jgi:hypothetical protein